MPLILGPQQSGGNLILDDQEGNPLPFAATFGIVRFAAGANLSGGHDFPPPQYGRETPQTDAEFHRQVQQWWNDHDNRTKQRPFDPNLVKRTERPVKRAGRHINDEMRQSVRADVRDAMRLHSLAESGPTVLTADEIAAIVAIADDPLMAEALS